MSIYFCCAVFTFQIFLKRKADYVTALQTGSARARYANYAASC